MSDEERPDETPEKQAMTVVRQSHGGAIRRGNPRRLPNPTITDVVEHAVDWLYRIIPRISTIATNRAKKDKKTGAMKRPFKVTDQLRAAAVLARLATLDRTLREARVSMALAATRQEIEEFFEGDRDRASALMAKIAPHWLGI